jgi:hypothetical protein
LINTPENIGALINQMDKNLTPEEFKQLMLQSLKNAISPKKRPTRIVSNERNQQSMNSSTPKKIQNKGKSK